jgi:predicted RNA-binding protein with TRAM domain
MTRKCPTCGGDGIVYSEASAAIDVERRLRALVAGSRSQAYRVELAAPIAAALVGPGARRLVELESLTKRRFFLDGKDGMHLDHFVVLAEGKLADLAPAAPVAEGAEAQVELVEVDRHDASAAVGKLDGIDVCVGDAAGLVGKRVKVRIERVLDGAAYASLLRKAKTVEPLTAEAEAEKPTRKPPARKGAEVAVSGADEAVPDTEELELSEEAEEAEEAEEEAAETADGAAPAKKKTRRGSRGGRGRKKPAGAATTTTIHLPPDDLGAPKAAEEEPPPAEEPAAEAETDAIEEEAPAENGAAPKKKKTRRGSRGGRNRKKRPAAAAAVNGDEPAAEASAEEPADEAPEEPAEPAPDEEWGYVPMSEWGDELQG